MILPDRGAPPVIDGEIKRRADREPSLLDSHEMLEHRSPRVFCVSVTATRTPSPVIVPCVADLAANSP